MRNVRSLNTARTDLNNWLLVDISLFLSPPFIVCNFRDEGKNPRTDRQLLSGGSFFPLSIPCLGLS